MDIYDKFYSYNKTLFKMKSFSLNHKINNVIKYLLTECLNIDENNYDIFDNKTFKIDEMYNNNIKIICNMYNIDDFRKLGKLISDNIGMIYYDDENDIMYYEYDFTELYNELTLNDVKSIKYIVKYLNNE
jgi:hypothetical protein